MKLKVFGGAADRQRIVGVARCGGSTTTIALLSSIQGDADHREYPMAQ
jgi:hypothetical protein